MAKVRQVKGLRQTVYDLLNQLKERRQKSWLEHGEIMELYKDLLTQDPGLKIYPFESVISCIIMWREGLG